MRAIICQQIKLIVLSLLAFLLVIISPKLALPAHHSGLTLAQLTQNQESPPLKSHPLPPLLAQQSEFLDKGDYFAEILPVEVGYLIWSDFPVKVFIESSGVGSSRWVAAVSRGVEAWAKYMPLQIVTNSEGADISIWHRQPPLRREANGEIARARSAETRYEYYLRSSAQGRLLAHRFNVYIGSLADAALEGAARHELGHALGIWGHSPLETDALYFSQVPHPAPISARDINTLRQIYQQPTRLGWPVD